MLHLEWKRGKHPDKDIEKALQIAEGEGWRVEKASGGSAHPWGRIYCPLNTRMGCRMSIWSTPRSTTNHARQIQRHITKCEHTRPIEENNNEDI